MKNILLLLTFSILLAGCKSTPAAKKSVVMPAKVAAMQEAKSLAVISVNSANRNWYLNNASSVQPKFESFLTNINVNGKNHFNLVDRTSIDRVIKEQRISSSDNFDEDTATKLGNLVGADILVTANFLVSDLQTSTYKGYEKYCIRERKSGGLMGKLGGTKCEEYRDRAINCKKHSVTVEFTPKGTSVETGTIVYAKNYKAAAESKKCPNEQNKTLKSGVTLVSESFDNIFRQMRRDIAPYGLMLELHLIEDDKSKMPAIAKQNLAQGMFFVEKDMFERACPKFEQAAASFGQSPAIMYNMGVCQDMIGDKVAAKAFYERALDLAIYLSSDDQDIVINA
ncbi:MAG: CsgG/HfaB family protein, partial [Colwellia sp.]|nr:CsgG/HfaB family protein [Colwellia sp.]